MSKLAPQTPRQKRKRVNRNKKTNRRGRYRRQIRNLPLGLPNEYRMKMRYSDCSNEISSPFVPYTYYRWAMTSLFAPDLTSSSAQPPLYDNMLLVYSKYRVNSCKITVTIEQVNNFPVCAWLVGRFDPATNSPASIANPSTYDIDAIALRQRSKRIRIGRLGSATTAATVSKTFYPKDFVVQNYESSVNFAGTSAAPSAYAVVDLILQNACTTGTPEIYVYMSYDIEYDVTWFDRKDAETAAYD